MANNLGETSAARVTVDARAEMELYDSFPPAVRRALADAPIKWGARSVANAYSGRGMTPGQVALAIQAESAIELRAFAAKHAEVNGWSLPHVAARATVLGYGRRA